jgi:pyruvate/2-oxoglutarate dehydrogenase complex dihydrolipoamide acyltransferase (E2) component
MRWAAWLGTSLAAAALASPATAQDLETAVQESYPTNLVLLRDATRASVAELFIGFSAPAGETLLVEPDGDNPANWYVENQILAHLTESGFHAYLRQPSPRTQPETAASPPEREDSKPLGPRARREAEEAAKAAQEQQPQSLGDAMQTAGDSSAVVPDSARRDAQSPADAEAAPGSDAGAPAQSADDLPHPEYVLRYRVLHFAISYPKNYRTSPLGSRKVQRRVSVSLVASLLRGARENVVWVGDGSSERLDTVPAGKLSLLEGTDFPFTQPVLETRGLGRLVEPALVSGIVLGLVYLFYTNQD